MGMPVSYYESKVLIKLIRMLPAHLIIQVREYVLRLVQELEFEQGEVSELERVLNPTVEPSTTSQTIHQLQRLVNRLHRLGDPEQEIQHLNRAIRQLERLYALDQRTRQSTSDWVPEESYNDQVRRLSPTNLEARLVGTRWSEGVLLVQYEVHRRLERIL